jgi:hypothetical protein
MYEYWPAARSAWHAGAILPRNRLRQHCVTLARAVDALGAYLETSEGPEEARWLALKAAGGAAALLREREDLTRDMAISAFVEDIFSATYDLLLSTAMDSGAASRALEEAVSGSSEPG